MPPLAQELLRLSSSDEGFDWIVNYSDCDGEVGLLPIYGRPTVVEALDEAAFWLDGSSGENIGKYEITGIVRRDIIGNADEMLGTRNLN
jgi:hypothetical protein